MRTYRLIWSDNVEVEDPRILTSEDGEHMYQFETGDMNDAEAVAQTFRAINPNHNFNNYRLVEVEEGEQE